MPIIKELEAVSCPVSVNLKEAIVKVGGALNSNNSNNSGNSGNSNNSGNFERGKCSYVGITR